MPSYSTFAQLALYNNTTDKEELFEDFRDHLDGVGTNSNMNIIDRYLSNYDTRITTLEDLPPVITVHATAGDSPNNYTATGVTEFTAYENNMLFLVYLDTANAGLITLKINDAPAKSIMKVDSDGQLVNLSAGDMKANTGYLLQYNGTSLQMIGQSFESVVTSADQPTNQAVGSIWNKLLAGGGVQAYVKQADGSYLEIPPATKAVLVSFADGTTLEAFKQTINDDYVTFIPDENPPGSTTPLDADMLGGFTANKYALIENLPSILSGLVAQNAGAHNNIYRGKQIGLVVSDEQYAQIAAGTFNDMYIGDYWTIGGVNWRIAAFDYYYNTGDTACTTHHVVIVPDTALYSAKMNDTDIVTGGYIGSAMYTTNLTQAKTTINTNFSGHVLTYRNIFVNGTDTNGYPNSTAWVDATIELMNEIMLYGSSILSPANNTINGIQLYTIDKTQLPLFSNAIDIITIGTTYWLRDIVLPNNFAVVSIYGINGFGHPGANNGIRPYFCLKG